jgi:Flp pilus assembly protein TadB
MITGALLVALALLVAAGAVALALAHLRRVRAAIDEDSRLDRAALLRVPAEARFSAVAERARPGSWLGELVDALRAARDDDERVAAANEALGDLARILEAGAAWPGAALRVCVSATLLLAVGAFLLGVPLASLPVCAVGGAGALASAELGRRARRHAERQRTRADDLVAALLPDLAGRHAGPARPSRRRRAWG